MTPKNKIQLCMGEVRHKRLRPVQHAFHYGLFFIRIPLRSSMIQRQSRLFSHNRFNLLSFHDSDHGDGKRPPLEWINHLLYSENIRDADGEIWLQCFPRVLGYVFNPVSFWFCHRQDGVLRAIVAEVCNTFGEKHVYLLDTGHPQTYGQELIAKKVFHVSPFCEVEGQYRFRFMRSIRDVAGNSIEQHVARIDYDDADGPLLLTSISGKAHALTTVSAAAAFCRFPLMTMAVMARIHWQALQLWLKRIPFFHKPIPPTNEVSR